MKTINRSIFPELKTALDDNRAVVITGMRRVGKTTTLRWMLEQVPTNNKLFMDLERLDQRRVFQEANYDAVLNYLRNQGLEITSKAVVALDEIQYCPNLPSVVKYLHDHYDVKFLLSGSSSFYLKNYFSESMAGRKVVFEMYPLGFGEFLDFRGVAYRKRDSFAERAFDPHEYTRLRDHYEEYIRYGGLPDVVLEARTEAKLEILKDIYSSYINIDVKTMADFRKVGQFQLLLQALSIRIGNKIDMTKLSQMVGITRPTLMEYLDFLEKTYIIYRLPAFAGTDRSIALGKKLYFRDNGIACLLGHPGEGALFENTVFNQLWAYGRLQYLSRGSENEMDFVVSGKNDVQIGLEVKYQPLLSDANKARRTGEKFLIPETWVIGRHPSPSFSEFVWGGLLF